MEEKTSNNPVPASTPVNDVADIEKRMDEAYKRKDFGTVASLAGKLANAQKELREKANEAITRAMGTIFETIVNLASGGKPVTPDDLKHLTNLVKGFTGKELDSADGVWFSRDFGDGNLTTIRLLRGGAKRESGGSVKSSYVTNEAKTSDLLKQVGAKVMFTTATTATIDKKEVAIPAGMTYQQAHDLSDNGGWRNRVRQAILKEAGLIQ